MHSVLRAARRPFLSNTLRNFNAGQVWAGVKMGPKDPILGVTEAYKADADPRKLNFGVGAYRDDDGKPVVLNSVAEAERRIVAEGGDMEYLPIGGLQPFVTEACKLVYPESDLPRISAVQALSGTGSLRLAADFIKRNWPGELPACYQPKPTWGNHIPIFEHSGIEVRQYSYYKPETRGLDYEGMMRDLEAAPNGQLVLLHATAHNPTGVDPEPEQWEGISKLCKSKGHVVLVDCAYQGFASGDFEKDVLGINTLLKDGHNIMLCQSFAKNFGLYGHRVGCFSIVCKDAEEKSRVDSQLKIVARAIYSNPPMHGARIVHKILTDPELKKEWLGEVEMMAGRIKKMRQMLFDALKAEGSTLNWDHVLKQIGMFTFSGMTKEQCEALAKDWHIYMTMNGRISMAGVTSKNVGYLAKAMHAVTK